MSNSGGSARARSCVDSSRASEELLFLNASTLLPSSSFHVNLSFRSTPLLALLDSGSSHCFIDFDFVQLHDLPLRSIPPLPLRLFDGSPGGTISLSIFRSFFPLEKLWICPSMLLNSILPLLLF